MRWVPCQYAGSCDLPGSCTYALEAKCVCRRCLPRIVRREQKPGADALAQQDRARKMQRVERSHHRRHRLGGPAEDRTSQGHEVQSLLDTSELLVGTSDAGVVQGRFETQAIDCPARLHAEQLARIRVVPPPPRREPPPLTEEDPENRAGVEIDGQR